MIVRSKTKTKTIFCWYWVIWGVIAWFRVISYFLLSKGKSRDVIRSWLRVREKEEKKRRLFLFEAISFRI